MSSIASLLNIEKLRPLGKLEQWYSARHNLGFFKNISVSASYSFPRSYHGADLQLTIFKAVSKAVSKHPILFAIPIDEDTATPYFARLPEINLEKAIHFVGRAYEFIGSGADKALEGILEMEHNRDFRREDESTPFWRLVILSNSDPTTGFTCIFTFHPSLADGISGVIFHNTLISEFNANHKPVSNMTKISSKEKLLPSLEDIHPLPIKMSPLDGIPREELRGLWDGAVVQLPLRSRLRTTVIPASLTEKFVKSCKAHQTTVTATLQVCIATTLFRCLSNDFNQLCCTVPVSLRRWIPPVPASKSMAVLIDGIFEVYRRRDFGQDPQFSWPLANRSRENMLKYLAAGGEHLFIARLKWHPDMNAWLRNQVGKKRVASFEVSNLGVVGEDYEKAMSKPKDKWRRSRVVFSHGASATGSALSVTTVTGPDGCLVLGWVWQEGIIEKKMVETVIGNVGWQINNIIESEA